MSIDLILDIVFIAICSFWFGLNLGRVLTLWQEEGASSEQDSV